MEARKPRTAHGWTISCRDNQGRRTELSPFRRLPRSTRTWSVVVIGGSYVGADVLAAVGALVRVVVATREVLTCHVVTHSLFGEATGLGIGPWPLFLRPLATAYPAGETGMPGENRLLAARGVYVPLTITAGIAGMPVGRLSRDAGHAGMPPVWARYAVAVARAVRRVRLRGWVLRRRRGRSVGKSLVPGRGHSARGCVP
jgi:hypothetical protein